MNELLRVLAGIVQEAAALVREVYAGNFEVEFKSPNDPVTIADKRANQLICERLGAAFPKVPIVAEESPPSFFRDFRSNERIFFVDPLDGTREFVKRNGEFCVMIGLVEGERAIAGVIHSPLQARTWCGQLGCGAFELDDAGTASRISVSSRAHTKDFRVVVSRSDPSALLNRSLAIVQPDVVRPLGSAGLKGVAVARGHADAYLAPEHAGMRWDACAVDALVCAAGGTYSDATGQPLDYRAASLVNAHGVLASNCRQHASILRCVDVARKSDSP